MSSVPIPPTVLPLRVAVIGGGITGLAATHRLAELLPRAEFEVFEASSRLGGVLHTEERDGYLIEQSADNFLVKPPAGIDLCRDLGITDDLLTTDESRRRAFVVRGGRLMPIPEGFYLMSPRRLWPILASPIISLRGKLRLFAEPFIGRVTATADESVASFARRRLGVEVFEQLVQPLVAGIYTADPEQLSMAATMPQFLEFERTRGSLLRSTLQRPAKGKTNHSDLASGARYGLFVAPRQGMTSLVEAVRNRLPRTKVRLNTAVTRITPTNGTGWKVESSDAAAPSTFDAVIIALPSHAAATLFESCAPQLAAELGAIQYASCAVVSLGYARQRIGHPLDGFGFVVPRSERRRIIAGSFASLKYAGRAPADQVLIRAFIGGALQPELLKLTDAELAQVAQQELAELLQISGEPLVTDVARWPRSMPQYYVGHLDRVRRIEELAAKHRAVALAGNAYRGVGIPQCIASGESAAEHVAAALSRSS
jgi:protoporphyrinogen/coproporphyrinogen III oxidase